MALVKSKTCKNFGNRTESGYKVSSTFEKLWIFKLNPNNFVKASSNNWGSVVIKSHLTIFSRLLVTKMSREIIGEWKFKCNSKTVLSPSLFLTALLRNAFKKSWIYVLSWDGEKKNFRLNVSCTRFLFYLETNHILRKTLYCGFWLFAVPHLCFSRGEGAKQSLKMCYMSII